MSCWVSVTIAGVLLFICTVAKRPAVYLYSTVAIGVLLCICTVARCPAVYLYSTYPDEVCG